jgi:hypothetical protein
MPCQTAATSITSSNGGLGEGTGIAIQRFQIDHCKRVIPLVDPSLLVALAIASNYKVSPAVRWAHVPGWVMTRSRYTSVMKLMQLQILFAAIRVFDIF